MEPVDLSVKTSPVVPKFPPQKLKNPASSGKIHSKPHGKYVIFLFLKIICLILLLYEETSIFLIDKLRCVDMDLCYYKSLHNETDFKSSYIHIMEIP